MTNIRATHKLSLDLAQRQVQKSFARLFESQERLASGKLITRPSDDPTGASRLLFFKNRAAELDQYAKNAAEGRTLVDSAASRIQDASDLIIDARARIIQGLTGTVGADNRETIATELDGIVSSLLSLGNSRVGNRFLFAGTASDTSPFVRRTDGGGRERVGYRGNDGVIFTEVGPGVRSSINTPGDRIFGAGTRGATLIGGSTGAASGAASDSGTGVGSLLVSHTATTFSGGGLASGSSAASLDNVIGNHVIDLVVDPSGLGGTIRLDGGPPFAFSNPEPDFVLKGPNDESIALDLTGVIANFSGQVTATGSGTLSFDGGATSTVIDFSANQQLTNSLTGEILNVDSSGIRRAGTDSVRFAGTLDVFSTILSIGDALRNDDIGTATALLEELDSAHSRLLQGAGGLGVTSNRLESAENRLLELEIRFRELISQTEDVDLGKATIEFRENETAYQAALLVTSRIGQLSLLNYT